MADTPENAHHLAAAKHAKDRADAKLKRAAKALAKWKASDPYAPVMRKRPKAKPTVRKAKPSPAKETLLSNRADEYADTNAVMARPIKLTPLQEKRYAKTIAKQVRAYAEQRKNQPKQD
jgi:hypothetical protein